MRNSEAITCCCMEYGPSRLTLQGERTDLVLGEKIKANTTDRRCRRGSCVDRVESSARSSELAAKAEEAFSQAKLYGQRSLAGFEVQTRRYLVMVSEARLEMPVGGVLPSAR